MLKPETVGVPDFFVEKMKGEGVEVAGCFARVLGPVKKKGGVADVPAGEGGGGKVGGGS